VTSLPLYSYPRERWAFAKSGNPVVAHKRGGYGAGRIVAQPDGTFRFQRQKWGRHPAQDEPVEIRRFESIVFATVQNAGDGPYIRFITRHEPCPR
jgi:hypothetical protein